MPRTRTSHWGRVGPQSPSLLLMTFLSIINPAFDLLFGYLCQCHARNLIRQASALMASVLYLLFLNSACFQASPAFQTHRIQAWLGSSSVEFPSKQARTVRCGSEHISEDSDGVTRARKSTHSTCLVFRYSPLFRTPLTPCNQPPLVDPIFNRVLGSTGCFYNSTVNAFQTLIEVGLERLGEWRMRKDQDVSCPNARMKSIQEAVTFPSSTSGRLCLDRFSTGSGIFHLK